MRGTSIGLLALGLAGCTLTAVAPNELPCSGDQDCPDSLVCNGTLCVVGSTGSLSSSGGSAGSGSAGSLASSSTSTTATNTAATSSGSSGVTASGTVAGSTSGAGTASSASGGATNGSSTLASGTSGASSSSASSSSGATPTLFGDGGPSCPGVDGGNPLLAPVVFHSPASAQPGDLIYLQGDNLAGATVVLLPAGTQLPILNSYAATFLAVQLPAAAPAALSLCIENANGSSAPVLLNRAVPYNLDTTEIVPGGLFRVVGKNLLQPGFTPQVLFWVDGGLPLPGVLDAGQSNTNLLVGTVPVDLPAGAVEVAVDNGNGLGPAPIFEPGITSVQTSSTADPFGLGVSWSSEFATIAAVQIDPTTDSNVSPHMVADGLTDNTAALTSAVERAAAIGGATIAVPAGTYLFEGSVSLASRVVIQGAGVNSTVFEGVNDAGRAMLSCVGQNHVGLADIGFTQETASSFTEWNRNELSFLQRLSVIEQVSNTFFFTTYNVNFAVENSSFQALAVGINDQGLETASTSRGVTIANNVYGFLDGIALWLLGVEDGYVANNTFVWDAGLEMALSPSGEPATMGMDISHAERLSLDGNQLQVAGGPVPSSFASSLYFGLGINANYHATTSVWPATGATATTLTDDVNLPTFTFPGVGGTGPLILAGPSSYVVAIVDGPGYGQYRHIVSWSDGGTLTVAPPWDEVPTAASSYLLTVPGSEDVILSNNTFNEWPHSVSFLWTNVKSLDLLNNQVDEGGGIYLRAQSNVVNQALTPASAIQSALVYDVNFDGNTVRNTTGIWNSYLDAIEDTSDRTPFGLGFTGLTFRDNIIIANQPNVTTASDLATHEGYGLYTVSAASSYTVTDAPPQLGTIFQDNTCVNCAMPFQPGTGDVACTYAGSVVVDGGSQLLNETDLIGGTVSQGDVVLDAG